MKKTVIILVTLSLLFSLSGCKKETVFDTEASFAEVELLETITTTGQSSFTVGAEMKPVGMDDFSRKVRKAVKKDWHRDDLGPNHIPGWITNYYATWEECEELIGVSVNNPLKDASWLEKTDMLEDGKYASIDLYGTEDLELNYLTIAADYLDRDVRIQMRVQFENSETFSTGGGFAEAVTFSTETVPMPNGNTAFIVIPQEVDTVENYFVEAYFAQDHGLYRFHIVSTTNSPDDVHETLEKILAEFK